MNEDSNDVKNTDADKKSLPDSADYLKNEVEESKKAACRIIEDVNKSDAAKNTSRNPSVHEDLVITDKGSIDFMLSST